METIVEECAGFAPDDRVVTNPGEIVPQRITIFISGSSTSGEDKACYFQLRWDDGVWIIDSTAIRPSEVPSF